MSEFESTCCGIPCIVRVLSWESYLPAIIRADPGDSHPAEGGYGEWEILDRKGKPAPWLEKKLTDKERLRIDEEVFNHMENEHDDY
jgi:hypothetical protein